MKKKILALVLCFTMVFTMTGFVGFSDYTFAYAEDNLEESLKNQNTDQEIVEKEKRIYDQLISSSSVADMYTLILDFINNSPEELKALTAMEIISLKEYVKELDPENNDVDTQDLLDTLDVLPNSGNIVVGDVSTLDSTIVSNQTWSGSSVLTSSATWTFKNGAIVEMSGPVTVPSGVTLTLKGWGGFARNKVKTSDYPINTQELFIIQSGGKLIIEGTSEEQPFIIDGSSIIAEKPLITSSGELLCNNAVVQNGKNRSVYPSEHKNAGKPNGVGGGILIGKTGSLTMNNCVISKNTASLNGGGIHSEGYVTISNSEISWNRAASAETAYSTVNSGRGGGFNLSGTNAVAIFDNVLVTKNAAMYYGGGGQVANGASFEMKGNTVFSYNEAILHGAGALHLTGDAVFTMNGGSMEYNTAEYCGGAIHSSYSCTLNLNEGSILNNTTYGRGAGIHINTGGAITLNEGITISGNKVFKRGIGSYAEMDATGDNWSNVKYEGHDDDFGYGGGVMIDSGTCTVAGATITDNYALNGGGGIALTMLNMGEGGLDDYMVISFAMSSGTISDNTTDGDGAGVYIMKNKAEENLKKSFPEDADEKNYEWALGKIDKTNKHGFSAEQIINGVPEANVSGGIISNNVAKKHGGGLFLDENTKFIISGTGRIENNEAVNGGGVYVAKGEAEVNGGSVSQNSASASGGGMYIAGNVTMTDGVVNKNIAVTAGGAAYISGGQFEMTSGRMEENMATGDGSNGGAVLLNNGSAIIGVKDCDGKNDNHSEEPKDKTHPVVQRNKAKDSGGGIAILGKGGIKMYCGNIIENDATNPGRGLNVYMETGTFDLYNGDIGKLKDPELVIVGGTLVKHGTETDKEVKLYYYHCNDVADVPNHKDDLEVKTALATEGTYFNLPDGEKYWEAPTGYRFFGWTFFGPETEDAKTLVRDKKDYQPIGTPILSSGLTDNGLNDNQIHMYALWAPEESEIAYLGVVIDGEYVEESLNVSGNPEKYTFKVESNKIELNSPVKDGYKFKGWYLYQNEGDNANWGDDFEPVYKVGTTDSTKVPAMLNYSAMSDQFFSVDENGKCTIEMGLTNFGDITLIAEFEPAFADLKVTKSGWDSRDENQTFVFNITGKPDDPELSEVDMTVTICGNGSVLVKDLPVGKYEVKEVTEWSWRYRVLSAFANRVTLDNPEEVKETKVINSRANNFWLSGDSFLDNLWSDSNKMIPREKVN